MIANIQLRRDTAENWTNTNPTLLEGEFGLETDTGRIKIGDGNTAWNDLPYKYFLSVDDKSKLDGIEPGAEVNVQADFNETDDTLDSFIKNKPIVGDGGLTEINFTATRRDKVDLISVTESINLDNVPEDTEYVHTDNNYTTEEKDKLAGIEDNANNYIHPTYDGDDIDIDTTSLSGSTVISKVDINITTDDTGHVVDANAAYETRDLTASDIGAEPADDTILKEADIGVKVEAYDENIAKVNVSQTFTQNQKTSIELLADDTTALDFRLQNNYKVTLTADADITLATDGASGCVGQAGVITISGSEHITGWGVEFKWKNVPDDLDGDERFAYIIEAEDSIGIGRVQ